MVLSSEPISKKTPVQAKNNPAEMSRLMAKINAEQKVLDKQLETRQRPPQPLQAATRLTATPQPRSKAKTGISVAPQKSGSAKISVRPVRGESGGLSLLGSAEIADADNAVTLDELVI
jgi:hypothetical protein